MFTDFGMFEFPKCCISDESSSSVASDDDDDDVEVVVVMDNSDFVEDEDHDDKEEDDNVMHGIEEEEQKWDTLINKFNIDTTGNIIIYYPTTQVIHPIRLLKRLIEVTMTFFISDPFYPLPSSVTPLFAPYLTF